MATRSRQAHTKSRNGCQMCKRRKVKCGEEHPSCSNCQKRGMRCDFATLHQNRHVSSSSSPANSAGQLTSSGGAAPETASFSLVDMELLHYFTTSTSLTFSSEPLMRDFWRVQVPRLGFSKPYILKSLLSLSALHVAHSRGMSVEALAEAGSDALKKRAFYIDHALRYHGEALEAMGRVDSVTSENYSALIAFSWLTTYFAFARPRRSDNVLIATPASGGDNDMDNDSDTSIKVPDWLVLFRGARDLRDGSEHSANALANVLTDSAAQTHGLWLACRFRERALDELLANIRTQQQQQQQHGSSDGDGDSTGANAKMEVLADAVDALQRSYGLALDAGRPEQHRVRAVFIWLYKVDAAFVALLARGDGEALCVLAFFCVLLQRLDHMWWMSGWGRHLVGRVHAALDDGRRLWIQWPLEEIGWIPDTH